MPNISDWKQANTNYAVVQSGSQDTKSRSGLVLGAADGLPTIHLYDDIRLALAVGSTNHLAISEHFVGRAGATTPPAPLTVDLGSSGTAAPKGTDGVAGGWLLLTTAAAADNDHVTVAAGANWLVSNGWTVFEAKVKTVDIASVGIEVGLSDAVSETAGAAFSDHSVAGVTDVATNAAIIAFDTDDSLTNWTVNSVNAGTPYAVDGGVAVALNTEYVIRVEINSAGDAFFYIDGTQVASKTTAVATTATLGPWISLLTRDTNAATFEVDYVNIFGVTS